MNNTLESIGQFLTSKFPGIAALLLFVGFFWLLGRVDNIQHEDLPQIKIRLTKIESNVEHLQGDVKEIKVEIKEMRKELQDFKLEMKSDVAEIKAILQRKNP